MQAHNKTRQRRHPHHEYTNLLTHILSLFEHTHAVRVWISNAVYFPYVQGNLDIAHNAISNLHVISVSSNNFIPIMGFIVYSIIAEVVMIAITYRS